MISRAGQLPRGCRARRVPAAPDAPPCRSSPAGWAVRKQLARALRQEGKVVEAIVELMAAGGPASSSRSGWNGRRYGGGSPADGGKGGGDIDALGGAVVAGGTLFPDFMTLEQGADSWSAATSGKWPAAASPEERSVMGAALARLWRRSSVRLGRSLSRVAQPFRSGQSDVDREAAALGTHPDMYAAVEPIYVMSGPTAASMAVRLLGMGWWGGWAFPLAQLPMHTCRLPWCCAHACCSCAPLPGAGCARAHVLHSFRDRPVSPHPHLPLAALPPPAAAGPHAAVGCHDDGLPPAVWQGTAERAQVRRAPAGRGRRGACLPA